MFYSLLYSHKPRRWWCLCCQVLMALRQAQEKLEQEANEAKEVTNVPRITTNVP
jgi:hypothetical protein